jgi:histidyl-tRNA synthetase
VKKYLMIQLIKGFRDILPTDVPLWQHIEKTAVDLFEAYGFAEIRIPIMEKTELFARSIGETTDIVEKEMYTFADRQAASKKGDTLLTLRPEATASIVRAYIQHKMYAGDPLHKFYMTGPMFRRERPQKGRYRQFYQIDAEIFGTDSAYADVLLIAMLTELLQRLGVNDTSAHINSLGCPECRPSYREALTAFIDVRTDKLCEDCLRRKERNPLRVLDCKVPACREAMDGAPELIDHLCDACRDHFAIVTESLGDLEVPYALDKRLVRGLDYYTRTTFEIHTEALGAQSAVAGGGRYDGLVEALGGPSIPASGFAIGFDRLAEIVAQQQPVEPPTPALFIAAIGEAARARAFPWFMALGQAGVVCDIEMGQKSLKAQMKRANRVGAAHVLIMGDRELEQGAAILRDMATKAQKEVPLENLVETLTQALK